MSTKLGRPPISQEDRIYNTLARHGSVSPGITPKAVAKKARVPVTTVYKRITDLRNDGIPIYTNTKVINGKRKNYYRLGW